MNNEFEKSTPDMNTTNIDKTTDKNDAVIPVSSENDTAQAPIQAENAVCTSVPTLSEDISGGKEASKETPTAYASPIMDIQEKTAEKAMPSDTEEVQDVLTEEPQAVPQASMTSTINRPISAQSSNGYTWDDTGKTAKTAKKSASSKGFRVFAASMLTVFTVSAVAIAGLMTFDFIESRNVPNGKDTVGTTVGANTDATAYNSGTAATLISTFKDVEGALTKSQVAAKCSPSAVGIVVEVESAGGTYYDWFGFGNYYSQPQITQGVGSGFVYTNDGYIITNHHVVEGASKITVYFHDKTEAQAELVGSDEFSDIAVIKVDPEGLNLVPMEIGNSDALVVGDEVIAIGCPAGIEYKGTVTDGIISAINRDVKLNDSGNSTKTMTLLQTNATINRGNSGGPLINSRGEVIGINTLKLGSGYEGIGFSIPMNGAQPIIGQLIEFGEVKERSENDFVSGAGLIGISGSDISEYEAEYYDIPRGVLVIQIDKDSSSAAAGLRRGDIITGYNGKTVKTMAELNAYKAQNKAGDEVTLTVYRDADGKIASESLDITFKLDAAK